MHQSLGCSLSGLRWSFESFCVFFSRTAAISIRMNFGVKFVYLLHFAESELRVWGVITLTVTWSLKTSFSLRRRGCTKHHICHNCEPRVAILSLCPCWNIVMAFWGTQEAIEKSVLKLIDFGLAREFQPEQAGNRKSFKLSLRLQGLILLYAMLFARSWPRKQELHTMWLRRWDWHSLSS